MIVARRPRRSGITLTEILIAILIMGVGLISLATLFPLGLLRLREGTRQGRAGTTFESAADDMDARFLLYKPSFSQTWYGDRDPFVQDADSNGAYYTGTGSSRVGNGTIAAGNFQLPANLITAGNNGSSSDLNPLTTGLPICYDPLWRSLTGTQPYVGVFDPTIDYNQSYASPTKPADEARFGAAIFNGSAPYISTTVDALPSAYGLQRLTNFVPWSSAGRTPQYPFTCNNFSLTAQNQPPDVAGDVFTSIDDIVFNPSEAGQANSLSPLVPDMSLGGPQADYRFTWFFTGRQVDANGNGAQFTGEVVVCDNRPFGFSPLPTDGTRFSPDGETVVEAIYGYGGNSRAVFLRWKNTLADPVVRVGSWICDTTYERDVPTYRSRVGTTGNSFIRCNWYQVAKRVDPTADPTDGTCRSMVVTLTSPVRLITNQDTTTFQPTHVNVALIMPSVINVFPRTFEVH